LINTVTETSTDLEKAATKKAVSEAVTNTMDKAIASALGGVMIVAIIFLFRFFGKKKNQENEVTNETKDNEVTTQTQNKLYCRKCGKELSLDSKFCFNCGTKVEN
jgi:uncharacterized membrane protein YvbJ